MKKLVFHTFSVIFFANGGILDSKTKEPNVGSF